MSTMAARLRELRERLNYSQEDMALVAGVSQVTWSTWEKGTPSQFSTLQKVAAKFGVSADYLLGLTDDPSPRRDEPLPEVVRDVVEIMLGLSEGRRAELLAHAKVLDEAQLDAVLAAYDQMFDYLAALPNGEELIAGFEEVLRTAASGLLADVATAERIVDALAASHAAKKAGEKPVE